MKLGLMIGGSAGQGINTAEAVLQQIVTKKGYFWHSYKDYMSRVRGGYNFSVITIATEAVYCHEDNYDIVLALTQDAYDHGKSQLKESGILIADDKIQLGEIKPSVCFSLPLTQLLKDTQNNSGLSMLVVGILCKLLSIEKDVLSLIENKKWSEEMTLKNQLTAKLGYETAPSFITLPSSQNGHMMTLSGNHAVALGAVAAGVKFYAAYPMAPSTSVMTQLLQYQKRHHIVMEQVEDEIAAANAILGASSTGVRAMTSTSGGGFSLMTEAVGLSAVSEIPMVVLDVQRPGPATGMATRTEQSDLNQMLGASQGEFPRFILSFKNVSECFYQTFRAFNLADQFRVPVLLLSDQYLADAITTVPKFDLSTLEIHRHINDSPSEDYAHYPKDYLLPRAIPGLSNQCVMNDSHEHNHLGQVDESSENRVAMNVRRLSKLADMSQVVKEPEYVGSQDATVVCLAWGSVTEVLKDAILTLNQSGQDVGALLFSDLYPLPQDKLMTLAKRKVKLINVEGNSEGQLAQLIARETGVFIEDSILKFDGRQMTPTYIMEALEEVTNDDN